MQREERIKKLLEEMATLGIIRITYDPTVATRHGVLLYSDPEIWFRTRQGMDGRVKENLSLTSEEKEYFASEYDKCFGTGERSDGN